MEPLTVERVLENLIDTIEFTGGVAQTPEGTFEPYGDREWTDLGGCYVDACIVLGREPKITFVDEAGIEIEEE